VSSNQLATPSPYLPQVAVIRESREVTARERYIRLELEQPLGHHPGQFVMVSVAGVGEAAISISSPPGDQPQLEMVVRLAGTLTAALHALQPGDQVGIRGPYGSGFELDALAGRPIVVVAGGLGLVPLRSLLIPLVSDADRFPATTLITGARTPAETLFRDELAAWAKAPQVEVIEMVDRDDHQPWSGQVGLVTGPLAGMSLDRQRTIAILCGPPVMYKFVLMELMGRHRLPAESVYLDLERRMRCGVGKCGHCQINQLNCCLHGPVFRYDRLSGLSEALR
jgi:sulfhydrogenase subunit gamma (sulfur reductase)